MGQTSAGIINRRLPLRYHSVLRSHSSHLYILKLLIVRTRRLILCFNTITQHGVRSGQQHNIVSEVMRVEIAHGS